MLPYDVPERAGTPFERPAEGAFWPFEDLLQRAFHQSFQQEVAATFGNHSSNASPAVTTVTLHPDDLVAPDSSLCPAPNVR